MLYKLLYTWLLPPAIFIFMLLGLDIYLYWRRAPGRKFLSLLVVLFYLCSTTPVAYFLAKTLENRYPQPLPAEVRGDVIILLGSGSVQDVRDFDGCGQPTGGLAKGILAAARLQRFTGLPVIVSGGTSYVGTTPEAEIAVRNLRSLGVPEDKLFTESCSLNTVDNAGFCSEICRQKGWQRPILLAAALHSPRANMLFAKYGLVCQPYPTHYLYSGKWRFHPVYDLMPDAYNLAVFSSTIKEYLGIMAVKLGLQ